MTGIVLMQMTAVHEKSREVDFPSYNFSSMNEQDIREEIVARLLRYLDYRSGTLHNIIREQNLQYDRLSLGRKKSTDPILRGRADYICEAHGKIRWVIEAKPPESEISTDDQEQAWSYANHPEIRGVYFCLTNGKTFKIFQTNRGPNQAAIFECTYEQISVNYSTISNILSPDAMLRDFPDIPVDTGQPIGKGLRSIVRITNGTIVYEHNSQNIKQLKGLTYAITDGSVERSENGKLEAYLETMAPVDALQKLNEKLGLHKFVAHSIDEFVSSDPTKPTIFTNTNQHLMHKGEKTFDLIKWQDFELPFNLIAKVTTTAEGYLEGNLFSGKFTGILAYQAPEVPISIPTLELRGRFKLYLS